MTKWANYAAPKPEKLAIYSLLPLAVRTLMSATTGFFMSAANNDGPIAMGYAVQQWADCSPAVRAGSRCCALSHAALRTRQPQCVQHLLGCKRMCVLPIFAAEWPPASLPPPARVLCVCDGQQRRPGHCIPGHTSHAGRAGAAAGCKCGGRFPGGGGRALPVLPVSRGGRSQGGRPVARSEACPERPSRLQCNAQCHCPSHTLCLAQAGWPPAC